MPPRKTPIQYKVPLVPGADFYVGADIADIAALKALFAGTAESHQQQRALSWIMEHASGIRSLSFRGSDRDTSFNEGRRFVGLEIAKYVFGPMDAFKASKRSKDSPSEQG